MKHAHVSNSVKEPNLFFFFNREEKSPVERNGLCKNNIKTLQMYCEKSYLEINNNYYSKYKWIMCKNHM